MKYLFIVQGEGRGHMTQAIALSRMLQKFGHDVAEVLVGVSPHRQIPNYFRENIRSAVSTFNSPNFTPSVKTQKVSILKTLVHNFRKSPLFLNSLKFIEEKIEEHQPDTVINFYDLIAGLLFEIKRPKVRFICIAHQYFFLHPHFRFQKPKNPEIAGFLYYSKLTCRKADKILALSLGTQPRYNSGNLIIVPPLLREEVFNIEPQKEDFILGYLLNESYENQIKTWHADNPLVNLHFFSDRKQVDEIETVDETLSFHKLNDRKFLKYLSECNGYATTGGFESVCEALYLQKPVLMVPAHVEQECNITDAIRAGAGIGAEKFDLGKLTDIITSYEPNLRFREWVHNAEKKIIDELT
jgi:uncharacterized protein (TIGR00661 family)